MSLRKNKRKEGYKIHILLIIKSIKYIPKILFKILFIIICLIVIWVIGLFAQLPLIPWIETNYYVIGKNHVLSNGYILKQVENAIVKIEVPNEFLEDNQCFDFWFLSSNGKYTLTVKDFLQTILVGEKLENNNKSSYLFWDNGSKKETFTIDNYEIVNSENNGQKKYVFFRSVSNVNKFNNFSIKIKTNFYIASKPYIIDTVLQVEKKHKLTWNNLRVH